VPGEQLPKKSGYIVDMFALGDVHSSRRAGDKWAAFQTLYEIELGTQAAERVESTNPW
jgi:hypothetical protein